MEIPYSVNSDTISVALNEKGAALKKTKKKLLATSSRQLHAAQYLVLYENCPLRNGVWDRNC